MEPLDNENTAKSGHFRSILDKIGHKNMDIRNSALKSISFKLENKLISISELIHERQFLKNILEWFNQSEVSLIEEILKLLAELSQHSYSAHYLQNIGAVRFLSDLRDDIDEYHHESIYLIIENLLHSNYLEFDLNNKLHVQNKSSAVENIDTINPIQNEICYTNNYIKFSKIISKDFNNLIPYDSMYTDLHSTINETTAITTPFDIPPIGYQSNLHEEPSLTQLITEKSNIETFASNDFNILNEFITITATININNNNNNNISSNNNKISNNLLQNLQRIITEYSMHDIISFTGFTETLWRTIRTLNYNEDITIAINYYYLYTCLVNSIQIQHQQQHFYVKEGQTFIIENNEFVNFLFSLFCYIATYVQHMLSQNIVTNFAMLKFTKYIKLMELILCNLCMLRKTIQFAEFSQNQKDTIILTFTHLSSCIQLLEYYNLQDNEHAYTTIIQSSQISLINDLCDFLQNFLSTELAMNVYPKGYLNIFIDATCKTCLLKLKPTIREILTPYLNTISKDTYKLYTNFVEVEKIFSQITKLIKLTLEAQINPKLLSQYESVFELCEEIMKIDTCHQESIITECIVEIIFLTIIYNGEKSCSDYCENLLLTLIENTFSYEHKINGYYKFSSLIKLSLSGQHEWLKIGKDCENVGNLLNILCRFCRELASHNDTVWMHCYDTVELIINRMNNEHLLEKYNWEIDLQLSSYNIDPLKSLIEKMTGISESAKKDNLIKMYVRFCYHSDENLRTNAENALFPFLNLTFKADMLQNATPSLTESKVGRRIAFHEDDVVKIVNIMTSSVIEDKLKLSAFEQLHVLLQDPKLHTIALDLSLVELLLEKIKNLLAANIEFSYYSIHCLRLLAQFNRNLTHHLMKDCSLVVALLYWAAQNGVSECQKYNISMLVFMLVYCKIFEINEGNLIIINQNLLQKFKTPFPIYSKSESRDNSILKYEDLMKHPQFGNLVKMSWEYEKLTNNEKVYLKYASLSHYNSCQYENKIFNTKAIINSAIQNLISISNEEATYQSALVMLELSNIFSLLKIKNEEIMSKFELLSNKQYPTNIQILIFKAFAHLINTNSTSNSANGYSTILISIVEYLCTTKYTLCGHFKGLLDKICNQSHLLYKNNIEFCEFLELYEQIAIILKAAPNLHCIILLLNFLTNTLKMLIKYDVILNYTYLAKLILIISHILTPSDKLHITLRQSKSDKLNNTVFYNIQALCEDLIKQISLCPYMVTRSLLNKTLYTVHCILNVTEILQNKVSLKDTTLKILINTLKSCHVTNLTLILCILSRCILNHTNFILINQEIETLLNTNIINYCINLICNDSAVCNMNREEASYLLSNAIFSMTQSEDNAPQVDLMPADTFKIIFDTLIVEDERLRSLINRFDNGSSDLTDLTVNMSFLSSLMCILVRLYPLKVRKDVEILTFDSLSNFAYFYTHINLHLPDAYNQLMLSIIDLYIQMVESNSCKLPPTLNIVPFVWLLMENSNELLTTTVLNKVFKLLIIVTQYCDTSLSQLIELLHAKSAVILKSMREILNSDLFTHTEIILPFIIIGQTISRLDVLEQKDATEFWSGYDKLLSDFFDNEICANHELIISDDNSNDPSELITNGQKITKIIIKILDKSHPVSKYCRQEEFIIIENCLICLTSVSTTCIILLDNLGYIETVLENIDSITTQIYQELNKKSQEYHNLISTMNTKFKFLTNILANLPDCKQSCMSGGIIELCIKLWPFCRGVDNLDLSLIKMLTNLALDCDKACTEMVHPKNGPILMNDVIKKSLFLLKQPKLTTSQNQILSAIFNLFSNTCIVSEARKFLHKANFLIDIEIMLSKYQDRKVKINQHIFNSALELLTQLSSYDDGQQCIYKTNKLLTTIAEIGEMNFNIENSDIIYNLLLLFHNLSFLQSAKPFILSNEHIIIIMAKSLNSNNPNYYDVIGNFICGLLHNFNKGRTILKKTQLYINLNEVINNLSIIHKENVYLNQALMMINQT